MKAGAFSRKDVTPPGFLAILIDSTSSTLGSTFLDFSYEFFGDTLFFINFYDDVFLSILPESDDPSDVLVTRVGRLGTAGLCVGDIFLTSCLGDGLFTASVSTLLTLFVLALGLLLLLRAVTTGDLLLILGSTDFLIAFLLNYSAFLRWSLANPLIISISFLSFLNSWSFSLI